MRNIYSLFVSLCFIIIVIQGCSAKWTETIKYGTVAHQNDTETVEVKIRKKLIIVPITIKGKEYHFLFDTGAPFSISKRLQKDNNFKVVSKGNIVDSDSNRKKVSWVQVDSIGIGNVFFSNQTAFVGNFEANPVIKCLALDGIIGSNLIRQSNWIINQEQSYLSLARKNKITPFKETVVIPFETDYQYNIFIDLYFGPIKVKNVLVDYGSNGSVTLNNKIFNSLNEKNILGNTFIEKGIGQSGIVGKAVELNRHVTYSDSVKINGLQLENVIIKTGNTTSIGNGLLSRFNVTIDWSNKKLYLSPLGNELRKASLAGFRLGYSKEKGVYVQSVLGQSDAYYKGLRPNMKVVKIDSLDFEKGSSFCDYLDYEPKNEILLGIINSKGQRIEHKIKKTFF